MCWGELLNRWAALVLHTLFAASCLGLERAIVFFDLFAEEWLPRDSGSALSGAEERQYWGEVFEQRYHQCRDTLVPFVHHYWHRGLTGKIPETPWLAAFRTATRRMHRHYCRHILDEQPRLTIYRSFIHMTNNRLGVPNHDEAFVAYLLSRSLRELSS